MIDPFLITTGLAAATAFVAIMKAKQHEGNAAFHRYMANQQQNIARHYRGKLLDKEAIEADAKRRRSESARHAATFAVAARSVKAAIEDPARRAKTIAELSATTLRSRAQVVAPVKAARTRKKNSGGGAASKQG